MIFSNYFIYSHLNLGILVKNTLAYFSYARKLLRNFAAECGKATPPDGKQMRQSRFCSMLGNCSAISLPSVAEPHHLWEKKRRNRFLVGQETANSFHRFDG